MSIIKSTIISDWTSYLPTPERQYKQKQKTLNAIFDTDSCVSFTITNAIETQLKYWTDKEHNLSDRFLAKISGTSQKTGNNADKVANAIVNNGLVDEVDYPFEGDTWGEYMSPIPIDVIYKAKGWLDKFSVSFNWVFTEADKLTHEQKLAKIREQLKTTPVCVGSPVCPDWSRFKLTKNNKPIKDCGKKTAGHFSMIYKLDDKYQYRFDTYEPFEKKCELDYWIQHAFVIKVVDKKHLSLLKKVLYLAQDFLRLKNAKGSIPKN